LLQRHFVPYVDVMTISMWRSEEALRRFNETRPKAANHEYGGILLEPHTYELILSREIEPPDIEFDA
jgi:heme-degrading monooxygenase HmoA